MFFENLFRRFNIFYAKIFRNYGVFLSKYPVAFIFIAIILNIILSIGIIKINVIQDSDELFMVKNSEARKNEKILKNLFGNNETLHEEHYLFKLFDLGTTAEINFRVRKDPNANILNKQYFDEILSIHKNIENITVQYKNETVRFEDLCATRYKKCWIEGSELLESDEFFKFLKEKSLELQLNKSETKTNPEDLVYFSRNGLNVMDPVMGKDFKLILDDNDKLVADGNQKYAYSDILKLMYQFKFNPDVKNEKLRLWQQEFLKFVKNLKTNYVSLTYSISSSLEEEIEASVRFDTKLLFAAFMIIIALSIVFISSGIMLSFAGIFTVLFAISSSIGLLSLIGFQACSLIILMPILVLG